MATAAEIVRAAAANVTDIEFGGEFVPPDCVKRPVPRKPTNSLDTDNWPLPLRLYAAAATDADIKNAADVVGSARLCNGARARNPHVLVAVPDK